LVLFQEVFRNEFNLEKNTENIEKEYFENEDPGQPDFKIEWEEDSVETVIDSIDKKEKPEKKKKWLNKKNSDQQDFIIEWDEENDTIR